RLSFHFFNTFKLCGLLYSDMSYSDDKNTQSDSESLESAQKNQKKVGAAASDPSTTGPAETLREEAAQNTGENESKEPA
ncbi:MAG TPA: hypothetical protein VJ697_09555, partial [Nitrososphaeraceae archaeon]|nr:hypothetical protein [Nitrososphaeraceae archaeon]